MPAPLRIAFLTHEPFYPPSGGGSAEAVYLVQEMARRGHEVHVFGPQIPDADGVAEKFGVQLHPFEKWEMGRYAKFRNFKYLAYPFFLERMVRGGGPRAQFDLIFSQHAISAVAAGKLKRRLGLPVVMNFPDLLTGFMETWPAYVAPRPVVQALMRYEISLPVRYQVDGVCAISDEFAGRLAARGYPREKICPIYYGYDAQAFPLRAQPPPAGQPPVVVMHGSFDAHHLGAIAFEAVRTVAAKRPETIFRFVGRRTAGLEKFLQRAQAIPHFKFEAAGFTPYAEVSKQLASATRGHRALRGIGGHALRVCGEDRRIRRHRPADGLHAAEKRPGLFQERSAGEVRRVQRRGFREPRSWNGSPRRRRTGSRTRKASAARVRAELDWGPLCRKAVDFAERIAARRGQTAA